MGFPILPGEASTQAVRTDHIVVWLMILSCTIVVIVFGLIVGFAFRYRNGSTGEARRPARVGEP